MGSCGPRRRAGPIGRSKQDDPFGFYIAFRGEARHRAHMHALPGLRQRGVQRYGEAPGAAALAADKQDRLGPAHWPIAPDAGPPAPSGKPDRHAGRAHGRDAERHQPKHQPRRRRAVSGVQHVDGFRETLPPGQVGPGKQRSVALIETPGPPVGLQREGVRRIAGIGKAQLRNSTTGVCCNLVI